MSSLVRPVWLRLFGSSLICALVVFAGLSFVRAYGYFGGARFHGPTVMLAFVLMWLIPPVFLTAAGRRAIGLSRPAGVSWLPQAMLSGAAAALVCFALGLLLYSRTPENWFVSIGATYWQDKNLARLPLHLAFLIFTVPAMIFSPIGEEILFRGFIQESARERWSWTAAAMLNAALFAAIHLVHHGFYRENGELRVWAASGVIWLVLMFLTSLVFTFLRRVHGSIWPSIVSHAFFNLTMNYTIFYHLRGPGVD
jgi:uncharacterized protein